MRVIVLLLAFVVGAGGLAFSAEPTRFNDKPLRGVTGFSVVVVAHPRLARQAGIDTKVLQSAVEARLKASSLLAERRGSAGSAGIYVGVSLTPPEQGLQGWYVVMQIQDSAHLVRDPEAGVVVAVTLNRATYGLSSQAAVQGAVQHAVDKLISGLVEDHSTSQRAAQ